MAYNVKFLQGTAAQYNALTVKDANTFYYVDNKDLYLGEIKLSSNSESAVAALQSALTVLNGADSVKGSVAQQIKTAIDALKAGEIKDAKDAADAAQTDVNGLKTLVGTIPAGAKATTVVEYAKEVANAASGSATGVAEDLANYKKTNDAAVAKAAKAAADEKTRAEGVEAGLQTSIDGINTKIGTVGEGQTVMGVIAANQTADRKYTDDQIKALGSVLNFKGTKATVAELPTDGKVGDVWHVTAKSAEYVCTAAGNTWEELGSVIDLSAYETITDAETKIATAKSEAIAAAKTYTNEKDTAMDTRVKALETAVGEGSSVGSQITAAINKLDATVENATDAEVHVSVTQTDGKLTAVTATVKENTFDAHGAAATAETNAKTYADGLAKNYDKAGDADKALASAKSYVDTALTWGTI